VVASSRILFRAVKKVDVPTRKRENCNKKPASWRARVRDDDPEHLAPFFHEGGHKLKIQAGNRAYPISITSCENNVVISIDLPLRDSAGLVWLQSNQLHRLPPLCTLLPSMGAPEPKPIHL
jgi:hypothetical protein